jgi:hypothetical protein
MTILFVGLGVLILAVLLSRVRLKVRVTTNVSFRDLRQFSSAFSTRAIEYMRANYSGDPAQLDGPLRGLVAMAREMASQQSLSLDDGILSTLIVATLSAGRFAPRGRIESAMESILPAHRAAA